MTEKVVQITIWYKGTSMFVLSSEAEAKRLVSYFTKWVRWWKLWPLGAFGPGYSVDLSQAIAVTYDDPPRAGQDPSQKVISLVEEQNALLRKAMRNQNKGEEWRGEDDGA